MIDHTGITVSDLDRSKAFYQQVLAVLGYKPILESDDAVSFGITSGYGVSTDPGGDFWLNLDTPMNPRLHLAFSAASREDVDRFHAAGVAAGGTDNGKPGLRPGYHANYYAAFIIDPDGYNIEAVCHR